MVARSYDCDMRLFFLLAGSWWWLGCSSVVPILVVNDAARDYREQQAFLRQAQLEVACHERMELAETQRWTVKGSTWDVTAVTGCSQKAWFAKTPGGWRRVDPVTSNWWVG